MAALEWTCHKEGMLRKSHRGAASILNPRYFVSDGFHVMYFESEAMKTRHGTQDSPRMRSAGRTCHPGCRRSPACMPPAAAGRFDLRNVQMLRPAADMYNAVEFVLSEGCPQHVEKCTPRGTEPHTLSAGREPRGWGAAAGAVGGTLSPWLIPLPPPCKWCACPLRPARNQEQVDNRLLPERPHREAKVAAALVRPASESRAPAAARGGFPVFLSAPPLPPQPSS